MSDGLFSIVALAASIVALIVQIIIYIKQNPRHPGA